ncbi:MAG: tRNA (adenosine(37)-N6)-dimethylallyltransferase MiaA [Gemmatimonadota bacterium]
MTVGAASPDVLAIVGPTGTGKSAVAVEVARRIGGEIISVDSRQAYRGMEIGTVAPTLEERSAVRHHGVAFLEPSERYSAGRFARLARGWIAEIEGRGAVPILVGGTGFFLGALLAPIFREPELDEARRERLRTWLAARPVGSLADWVRRIDDRLARQLGTIDRQRAARALEVAFLTGRPLSWWHEFAPSQEKPLAARVYVLQLPADENRRRIEDRVAELLESGWEDEVGALLRSGHDERAPGLSAVGYRHVVSLVRGELTRTEAMAAIFRDSWQYARRQRTWFRHQLPAGAVRLDARQPVAQLAERIAAAWRGDGERVAEHATGGRRG